MKNEKIMNQFFIALVIENYKMKLRDIIEKKIYSSDLIELPLKEKCIINTINPHSFCVAKNDTLFSEALFSSDILLPDGTGIVLASKVLIGRNIEKIAGADIHFHLLKYANKNGLKVFYLGASKATLNLIENKIQNDFSNIKVNSFSPPYKNEFSDQESNEMCNQINSFGPDILFVGMTAPKQEKWVFLNKKRLSVNCIVSIGAVFDFYAGTVKRPGKIWINSGLEWFPRLLKEPRRLWRRNFVSTPKFLFYLLREKIN